MATKIDNLAQEIMEGLKEYADLSSDDVKKAVKKAGNEVRKEISASANGYRKVCKVMECEEN